MRASLPASVVCACCVAGSAQAGSVLTLKTTEYTAEPPIVGTLEIATEENDSRLEITSISSSESGGLIYSSERNAIIAMDHGNREYYVIGQTQIDELAAQFEVAMKETEEALAKLPPEQRAVAEEVMQSRLPPKRSYEGRGTLHKTGATGMFAGHECDYYDVLDGERKFRDICVTRWDAFPEGQEVAGAMKSLGEFFRKMTDAFARSGGMDLMGRQQQMFSYMEEVGGYPIQSREYNDAGQLESETVLQSALNEELEPARFKPPETYQDRPLM